MIFGNSGFTVMKEQREQAQCYFFCKESGISIPIVAMVASLPALDFHFAFVSLFWLILSSILAGLYRVPELPWYVGKCPYLENKEVDNKCYDMIEGDKLQF